MQNSPQSETQTSDSKPRTPGTLSEIARLFFRLGLVAFGGPAAHIAMMEDEFVSRRKWISREHFLDLIGATNLIPGPNSTEMTMHIGYERGGWAGLFIAGACFIFPAAVLTGILAWVYLFVTSDVSAMKDVVDPFLAGIKPAVIAIILGAVWKLGNKAVKDWRFALLGVLVAAAVLVGVGEIIALFTGGILGALFLKFTGLKSKTADRWIPLLFLQDARGTAAAAGAGAVAVGTVSLWKIGLFFLKIGAILYGSGYVLVAFLEGELVQQYQWLTQAQLLDAIAIGQFTPGPVLTTATFIGYILSGTAGGAIVATLGIFLPSFIFVLILNPLIPKLRTSAWTSAFLDAVNVCALALMVAVTIQLGMDVLVDWRPWVIAILSAILVVRFKVNAAWIVVGSGLLGWLLYMI